MPLIARITGTIPLPAPWATALSLKAVRKDGIPFPGRDQPEPGRSEDGFRATAIMRDITDRRQAEEHLRAVQEQYTRELTLHNQELALRNRKWSAPTA